MIVWIILLLISLVLAVALVGMVLLQPSKGGGMTSAFGSLGTSLGSTFGSRRTLDFLSKATVWVATGIGVLCLVGNLFLKSMLSGSGGGVDNMKSTINPVATPQPAPAPGPGVVPQGVPQAPPAGQPQQGTTPQQAPPTQGK